MSTIEQATRNVRLSQSPLSVRKESLSALLALLVWVATLIAENIDTIPAVAGTAGQVIGVVASIVAYGVARLTVPALTKGQASRLEAEAARLEAPTSDAAEVEEVDTSLPVYTGLTVNDGRHHRAD